VKYSGGLDGLRGVAVAVVVLFHAQVPFASGGFLGVSLFFTLSGFLITTLLLAEFETDGTVSLRRFYLRRARRLLPAAYVTLLLVALLSAWWSAGQRDDLPGDLIASVANVANWRFALAPTSYADLFLAAPSPVAHFWSLAIEEQIYLVLPIVVVIALRRGRGTLVVVTAALLAASVAATLVTTDRDLVYNGTHTRAAELLIGVALALALRRDNEMRPLRWRGAAWLPGAAAGVAFLALVVMSSLDQSWIYDGGLPLVSVVSAVLIAAVVSGHFPNRVLDVAPLVALGRLSYGIYLFHWPIFLLLDAERTGLGPVSLFVVRCAATGVVAVASAHLLEQPIRLGRRPRATTRFVGATAAAALAVVAAAVAVPPPQYTRTERLVELGDAGPVDFRTLERPPAVQDASSMVQVVNDVGPDGAPAPFRVAVIGSERSAVEAARSPVIPDDPDLVIEVIDDIRPECPLSTTSLAGCGTPLERFRALAAGLTAKRFDVLVIATGAEEDEEIAPRRVAARTADELSAFAATQTDASAALRAVIDAATVADAHVILYSTGQRYGHFDDQLVHLAIGGAVAGDVVRTETELSSAIGIRARAHRSTTADDSEVASPLRVLVVGDSTSLNLAMALNDGGDGRVEVLWAGANGCPLAPVEATRSSSDAEWTSHDCEPYASKLAPLMASFAPDAVLVVSGPTELTEHRFAGDPAARVAGDLAFAAARDRTLAAIAGTAAGVPVLVADVPGVRPGGFASREMTDPARLDVLNDQIARWDLRSEQIAVFPYRGVLEAAERTYGQLRTDGVHPDAAPLEALARSVYVDLLIDMTDRIGKKLANRRPAAD
jgi:peptidoglycan/LPS O-acetylase OafA/YrhL